MPRRDFYVRASELDDFQTQVIDRRVDSSFIVQGCAGSGKSILALWKVKQIQERNLGSFVFIVFTKTLKQYMKDGIRSIGLNANNITHYHQWNGAVVDYVIVDEAQDFTRDQILEFKRAARKALILYGDTAQQMYKFRNPAPISIEEIMVLTRFPYESLQYNHRLPRKIARLAEKLNVSDDDIVNRCRFEGIEMPKILEFRNKYEQFDKIIQMIRNRNMVDVGILFRTNKEVENATEYFNSKGTSVEMKVYDDMSFDFNTTKPKLITYHSSKGTQFQHVFLPECTADHKDDKAVLYVALTRTYEGLYIMHSGNLSPFLRNLNRNLYEDTLTTTTFNI